MSTNEEKKNVLFGSENQPWQEILSNIGIGSEPTVSPPEQDPCCTYDQIPGISCQPNAFPNQDNQISNRNEIFVVKEAKKLLLSSPYRTWF